jgi:hypothetical protein
MYLTYVTLKGALHVGILTKKLCLDRSVLDFGEAKFFKNDGGEVYSHSMVLGGFEEMS